MVFSSIPAYLDPSNWQQQQNHQIGGGSTNPLLPPAASQPVPPPPPPPQPNAGGGTGSVRPGSMSERARLANIAMPEAPMKCPRCDSTNTKFCYFNNYSLSQPRHFCKTCRRYWTRGGALRNVPVGGGCRRNKRSKSKSPASSDRQTTSSSTSTVSSNSGAVANIFGLNPQLPPLRFMSPLSQLTDNYTNSDISLNYSGISAPMVGTSEVNFHLGNSLLGGAGGSIGGGMASLLSSGGGVEQWRLQQVQQFPFLSGLDPSPAGLYQFQGGLEQTGFAGETQVRPKFSSSILTQMASVKMEDNPELNLSRQLLGMPANDQWSGSASWTDLSSFISCSTSNPL